MNDELNWFDRLLYAVNEAVWVDPIAQPQDLAEEHELEIIELIGENFAGQRVSI